MSLITPDLHATPFATRFRSLVGLSAALLVAFVAALILRPTGAYNTTLDGWGVDAFEVLMGAVCIWRYFEPSWRAQATVARAFPLILGLACITWASGDVARTFESFGGATAAVPSPADGFYLGFFPICYTSYVILARRGNRSAVLATSLDGVIAGLGLAAVSAAYLFGPVQRATGGGSLSTATSLAYPLGDLLLLAFAVACIATLPSQYKRFFGVASIAMVANAMGDFFNLLQPSSRMGYISNSVAWPIAFFLFAVAVWRLPASIAPEKIDKTAGFTLPLIGVAAVVVIFVSDTFGHVEQYALGLATATLVVAGIRMTITVREGQALKSARFRSLIDKAWDLIVVTEADLTVAYTTPSSERVLGVAPDELQGRPITALAVPDDVGSVNSALRDLQAGHAQSVTFESRMAHADGTSRIIAWTVTDMLADPSVGGLVLNGADVTEARRAAEELVAARDAALSASKAKSQFLSTMSHEIRTPMNGVMGLTELLLDTDLDADQLDLVSGVKVSAENLLVVINDILDFSKIEAGKLEVEEAPMNVASVLDDVGRILARTAHTKGIELMVDAAPELPQVLLGDRVRIQQVLLNLGSNAVKFTDEGEVVIRASVLHDNAKRVALHFDVIDMGIGIAKDDQDRLFQAFAQADSSTTRRYGGTGLGLTICRQLVELMGGKIGVVSTQGQGSTFWFELSLRRTSDVPADQSPGEVDLAGRRALVVDDNATNRKILCRQLDSWGVVPSEAVDAYEALQQVATGGSATEQPFDFVVIDLNMPGMDGIELASTLKANAGTAPMTLFLLSSSGDRLSRAEAHLHGFAASLIKPVRSSELFDCLMTSLHPEQAEVVSVLDADEGQLATMMRTVLLVEDNATNQLVGSKVLTKLGYSFDIAGNGKEAVAAVAARRYDAVLMDCQMPEMDGYEATAAIRRMEGTERRTPIIAMTASAMAEDRDRCLASGMDDFIAKPVRPQTVGAALERWTSSPAGRWTRAAGHANGDARASGFGDSALDQAQIEMLKSLDDGHGGVFAEIVGEYLRQSEDGRAELLRIVAAGDVDSLVRAAHTLKGASANVGARGLAAVCSEIEMFARNRQLEDASGLVERFEDEFSRARDALTLLDLGA